MYISLMSMMDIKLMCSRSRTQPQLQKMGFTINLFLAGTVFRRQNLTSSCKRQLTSTLKELKKYNGRRPITQVFK